MNKYLTQLDPLYVAEGFLKPKQIIYRYNSPVDRWYYTLDEEQNETEYMGATYACDIMLSRKSAKPIINWNARNGEDSYIIVERLAAYGTLMHTEIANYERNGKCNFDEIREFAVQYANANRYTLQAEKWAYHLPRNVAAWIQLCIDKNVKVLAVEFPVVSPTLRIATPIDVICEMDFNKKRVHAIINLKSALEAKPDENKSFYESHDLQLQLEKRLFVGQHNDWLAENTPYEVPMVFNWSPNNWLKEPTYTLKNWTDKTEWNQERLNDYLPQLKWEFDPPHSVVTLTGKYERGEDLTKNLIESKITQ